MLVANGRVCVAARPICIAAIFHGMTWQHVIAARSLLGVSLELLLISYFPFSFKASTNPHRNHGQLLHKRCRLIGPRQPYIYRDQCG